ncbi:YceD family protein, partial [Mycobacterium lepromatosis]
TTEDDAVEYVVGNTIDLEQSIIDAVGLELPFAPTCRSDCPGLCAECGTLLASEPGHRHVRIDPWWAKLTDMLASDVPQTSETDGLRSKR